MPFDRFYFSYLDFLRQLLVSLQRRILRIFFRQFYRHVHEFLNSHRLKIVLVNENVDNDRNEKEILDTVHGIFSS